MESQLIVGQRLNMATAESYGKGFKKAFFTVIQKGSRFSIFLQSYLKRKGFPNLHEIFDSSKSHQILAITSAWGKFGLKNAQNVTNTNQCLKACNFMRNCLMASILRCCFCYRDVYVVKFSSHLHICRSQRVETSKKVQNAKIVLTCTNFFSEKQRLCCY